MANEEVIGYPVRTNLPEQYVVFSNFGYEGDWNPFVTLSGLTVGNTDEATAIAYVKTLSAQHDFKEMRFQLRIVSKTETHTTVWKDGE